MNTTMLRTNWPPVPNEQVGFRNEQGPLCDTFVLPLTGLAIHPYAWWYGCRFACEQSCRVQVSLCHAGGLLAEWTQRTGEWCPLPWLLPGALTDHEHMYLAVRPVDELIHPLPFFAATAAYIELPHIPPMDRFLFVSAEGCPIAHWNRFRKQFGTPQQGPEPMWQTIHTVLPPLRCQLDDVWDRTDVFCIHAWNEIVPLSP